MASYFNLTLDTLAPQGLTIKLNNGSQYTTSKAVQLAINVTDESADGYQMIDIELCEPSSILCCMDHVIDIDIDIGRTAAFGGDVQNEM